MPNAIYVNSILNLIYKKRPLLLYAFKVTLQLDIVAQA